MSRFRVLARGKDIKGESIDEYERRFRQAREWYLKFLADDDSWKPTQRGASPTGGATQKNGSSKAAQQNKVDAGDDHIAETLPPVEKAITTTVLLASGDYATLRLPERLARKDADRIANIVKALAFDEQLALPPGTAA